jgi:CRISPR type I-E-associated protein CasB/Cse2
MIDLLEEPLFTVREGDGKSQVVTLPVVFALLGEGKDVIFTALQAYQEHPWYSLLVYLAAGVLHSKGVNAPNQSAAWWLKSLRDFSEQKSWPLVESDLSKPAFLQYPTDDSILKTEAILTPDGADMIASSSAANHSRKKYIIVDGRPEHWVYALASAQGQSVSVAQYRSSARSTSSGRICVMLAPSFSTGERFTRDVGIALTERDKLIRLYEYKPSGGRALLWQDFWSGDKSLTCKDLDPFFIDSPRLFRMQKEGDKLVCYSRGTSVPRVMTGKATGDLWTPLNKKSENIGLGRVNINDIALTIGYEKVHSLIFDSSTLKPASLRHPLRESGYIVIRSLPAVNGKTFGYHERTIPIAQAFVEDLTTEDSRLAQFSKENLEVVAGIEKVLSQAVWALMIGSNKAASLPVRARNEKQHDRILSGFHRLIDDAFFQYLFRRAEGEDPDLWFEFVLKAARTTIDENTAAAHWAGRKYRGLAEAALLLDNYEKKERARHAALTEEDTEGKEEMIEDPIYTQLNDTITKIHNYIVALGQRDRGAAARLQNIDVLQPRIGEYYRIEALYIDPAPLPTVSSSERERSKRWATLVKLSAIAAKGGSQGLHRSSFSTGRALAKADFSNLRFERLLNAENAESLEPLMTSTVRFLKAKNVLFSLTDLAYLYLWPTTIEAKDLRRTLAKDYYPAC